MSVLDRRVKVPFKITEEMFETVKAATENCTTDEEKAKALFDFLKSVIKYGEEQRGIVGYRDAIEVWTTKEGVCGEMSYLFISLKDFQRLYYFPQLLLPSC